MEVDPTSPTGPQSYTILRIKRKRYEEPLDALVIESTVRRKKRGGLDVFQFAETVEPEAWSDRSRDLQDRISALEREQALKAGTQPVHDVPRSRRPEVSKQYKVVLEDGSPIPDPASPPSVHGDDKGQLDFKLYDAVLSSNATTSVDPEMEKFLPLLQEYLTVHDIKPSASRTSATDSAGTLTPSGSRSAAPVMVAAPVPIPSSNDPDFVWDVFYHRAGLANEYDAAANVATLTGLPNSLVDPYASASESEEEDEADEDSNAEEYYKNDYPDEESSEYDSSEGSDIFHEDTNDDDDHDWR